MSLLSATGIRSTPPCDAHLDRDANLVGEDAHHLGRDFEGARQAIGLYRDANRRIPVEQEVVPLRDQRGESLGGRGRIGAADDKLGSQCPLDKLCWKELNDLCRQ